MYVKTTDDVACALGNLEQAVSVVRGFILFPVGRTPLLLDFCVDCKLSWAGDLFVCMFIKRL